MNPRPHRWMCFALAGLIAAISFNFAFAAEKAEAFGGVKTSWHGFDRYDYFMSEADSSIMPVEASADGKNSGNGPAKGFWRCIIVVPKEAATGNPWSWQGCYWDHEPQTEVELLKRGFHIAYITADAMHKPGKHWDAWYEFLTEKHGLSKKPAFIGMSRGGDFAYTWATSHFDKVSCIYADNTACNPESMAKLGELAQHDVPILHVCGSIDPLLYRFSLPIENIYQQYGGRISTMIKDGFAHHPHSLRDPNQSLTSSRRAFRKPLQKIKIQRQRTLISLAINF